MIAFCDGIHLSNYLHFVSIGYPSHFSFKVHFVVSFNELHHEILAH